MSKVMTRVCVTGAIAIACCIGANAIGCGASTQENAKTTPSASAPPPSKGAALVTSACVLHAGSSQMKTIKGVADASCWYNAECITMPGETHPGDGFVDLRCQNTSCECEWARASTDPAARESIKEAFTIDAGPHDSDTCKDLLLHRCMRGMSLYESDAGTN